MNAHLPIGDIHIFLCSFLFHRMSKLFIPFPFLLCNYMRLSSARQMHTNPSIPVIPPAVKAILSTAFTAITPHSLASANATTKPSTNDTAVPISNIMYLYFVSFLRQTLFSSIKSAVRIFRNYSIPFLLPFIT